MAFNFLNDLINQPGPSTSNADDDGEIFTGIDDGNESDVDLELVCDLNNVSEADSSDDLDLNLDETGDAGRRGGPTRFGFGGSGEGVGWSETLHDVDIDDFSEPVGPSDQIDLEETFTALDYFNLIIPEFFFEHIVTETNRYASDRIAEKPDPAWSQVNVNDIKLFLYINFMFGIKQLPHYRHYWSLNDLLNVPAVSKVMSRHRYELMARYFHLNDNTAQIQKGQPGHDPIFKVRPLFDTVLFNSRNLMNPEREISIDEAMVAFTGRLGFKQYIRNKPNPWGIKLWCAADPHSGYLFNFQVYTGKATTPLPNGLGYHVVFSMGEPYLDRKHHFFYDNYFASIKLATDLLERGTYSCATIRPHRKGWPNDLKNLKKIQKSPTDSGVRMRQVGNLIACFFMDKRPVHILSTNANPTMTTTPRNSRAGRIDYPIPTPISVYNQGMGGVDLHDQLRSYYPVGRRSRKWWRCLVWFLLQVATINSHLIYKKLLLRRHPTQKPKSHLEFRLELIDGLRSGTSMRQHAVHQFPVSAGVADMDRRNHQQTRLIGRKKSCYECSKNKQRTATGRPVETVFGCSLCQVHLCKGDCFATFHQRLHN